MLRFIVYRYIPYKDSKISHASLLTLRHHLSQPPSPTPYPCPTPPSSTTHLTAPPPAHDLLHPALLPTSQPYHQYLPYYPPCSTTHLTALLPAHDLLLYSAIYPTSAYPTYVHTTAYPLLRSHRLHILSRTPHTHATLHTAHLPHRCTMPPPYLIGSTTQPYLGHLYPPFSSATFIGLIRPIAPIRLIRPTPTRARTGQVVGVIDLIGAIGLIPP